MSSLLKYDLFYNQTACGSAWFGAVSCLEDIAETFEQRSKELDGVFANRWEVFWDILAGRHRADGSFTGRMLSLLDDGANALLKWLDSTANAVLNQLASAVLKLFTLFINAPTYEHQADHVASLIKHVSKASSINRMMSPSLTTMILIALHANSMPAIGLFALKKMP